MTVKNCHTWSTVFHILNHTALLILKNIALGFRSLIRNTVVQFSKQLSFGSLMWPNYCEQKSHSFRARHADFAFCKTKLWQSQHMFLCIAGKAMFSLCRIFCWPNEFGFSSYNLDIFYPHFHIKRRNAAASSGLSVSRDLLFVLCSVSPDIPLWGKRGVNNPAVFKFYDIHW